MRTGLSEVRDTIRYDLNEDVAVSPKERIRFLSVHHYVGRVRRKFPYHSHDYYEISFLFRGQSVLLLNGERYPCREGQMRIVSPGAVHADLLTNDLGIEFMEEDDDVWEVRIEDCPFWKEWGSREVRVFDMGDYGAYIRSSLGLLLARGSGGSRQDPLSLAVLSALCRVILELAGEAPVLCVRDLSEGAARNALERIAATYNRGFSLDDLSDELYMSKSQLIRLFRQAYGITPVRYRISLQVMRAYGELVTTDHTVVRISEESGFDTPSYFSKLFKKETGLTPLEARRLSPYHIV